MVGEVLRAAGCRSRRRPSSCCWRGSAPIARCRAPRWRSSRCSRAARHLIEESRRRSRGRRRRRAGAGPHRAGRGLGPAAPKRSSECDRIVAAGESAQGVIAALQRHFLRLHRLRSGHRRRPVARRGDARAAAAAALQAEGQRLEQQCRDWSLAKLNAALAQIGDDGASRAAEQRAGEHAGRAPAAGTRGAGDRGRSRRSRVSTPSAVTTAPASLACSVGSCAASPSSTQPTAGTYSAPTLIWRDLPACKTTTSSASAMPSSTSSAAATTRSWRRHGCAKGSMQLVDAATVLDALRRHGPGDRDFRRLGRQHHGRRRLVRRQGRLHRQDRRRSVRPGVPRTTFAPPASPSTPPSAGDGEPTGRSLILVTPDGQRTMNTFARRQPAARRRRGGCRPHPLRAHPLSRGLPVRPARGQGRLPAGGRHRRQGRAAGGAVAVRSVLRRPAPARVPQAHQGRRVDILFANEAEIIVAVRDDARSTRPRARRRRTPSSPRSRAPRRAASS